MVGADDVKLGVARRFGPATGQDLGPWAFDPGACFRGRPNLLSLGSGFFDLLGRVVDRLFGRIGHTLGAVLNLFGALV